MRALYIKNHTISLIDSPVVELKKGEVRIKVLTSGICSTDLQLIHGYKNFEGIPGHEFVGVVVESESENAALLGKRVTGEINIHCKKCCYCFSKAQSHCENRRTIGIYNWPGAHAEYINLPEENLHILPENITTEQGIFVEPLAAAYEILEQIHLLSEHKIVVIGDGKLGLLITIVLAAANKNVHIIARHASKVALLTKLYDIPAYLAPQKPEKRTFDVAIECTGNDSGFAIAQEVVKPRGKIILKSTYAQNLNINISDIVVNEIEMIGSRCGPFPPAIKFLSHHDLSSFISAQYSLTNANEAYLHAKKSGALKIIINNTQ